MYFPLPLPESQPLCAGCSRPGPKLRAMHVPHGKGLVCPKCIRKANKSPEFEQRLHAALAAGVSIAETDAVFRRALGPLPPLRVPVGDGRAREAIAMRLRAGLPMLSRGAA